MHMWFNVSSISGHRLKYIINVYSMCSWSRERAIWAFRVRICSIEQPTHHTKNPSHTCSMYSILAETWLIKVKLPAQRDAAKRALCRWYASARRASEETETHQHQHIMLISERRSRERASERYIAAARVTQNTTRSHICAII